MTNVNVECCFCNKYFDVSLRNYNWSNKQKWKFFCSKECRIQFRTKLKNLKCFNCNKDIVVGNCDYSRSKTKKFFCNKSCAALVNSKGRIHNADSKFKISESLRKYYSKNSNPKKYISHNKIHIVIPKVRNKICCVICGKIFVSYEKEIKCCSRKCGQIYQFGSLPYTKDEVVNKIIETYKKINRTPQQRECERKLISAAVRFFGTWNKAVNFCGLKPNKSAFPKIRLKCKDGHIADSISERIVDEWLFENGIKHEKNKHYPNLKLNCDFYLTDYNLWIEYFGLVGHEEYEIGMKLKRQIAKDNNLKFIEIVPSDLYPKNKLNSFLPKIIGKKIVKQEGLFDNIKVLDVKMIGNAPIE